MDRRDFLSASVSGLSMLVVGKGLYWLADSPAFATQHVQNLRFRITDAVKEMVTHNAINDARCYFWVFKEDRFPADCPGPIVVAAEGQTIEVAISNDLDEYHSFFIKGVVDSGPIEPGGTVTLQFVAPKAGTYLYYDSLNAPVNRVMGLHGALVIMPSTPELHSSPYSNPTAAVQRLFDDFGSGRDSAGLAWGEGDPETGTQPFRQHVWLLHGASPLLFAEVGNYAPGLDYPASEFVAAYTGDRYANTFETGTLNKKPHFFTINGQSGFFGHHNPFISPWRRVGEPVVVRILNAGLLFHQLHLHANHYFVLAVDNKVRDNVFWVDTYSVSELQTVDIAIPFRRPPDVPNTRGIGLADPPLVSMSGRPVWPPVEEMGQFFPSQGETYAVRQSPLCYPMHDHSEYTQTAQGGNYPLGMMAGMNITGDRATPGSMNFPNYPTEANVARLDQTSEAAPTLPPHNA